MEEPTTLVGGRVAPISDAQVDELLAGRERIGVPERVQTLVVVSSHKQRRPRRLEPINLRTATRGNRHPTQHPTETQ